MAATDSVIPLDDKTDYLRHFESEQVKSGQGAEDNVGQQSHSQGAVVNDRGLPTDIMPCSVSAAGGQEASCSNEHSETSTINLSLIFKVVSDVCGVTLHNFSLIVTDMRCKGNPINYETLYEKCTDYNDFYDHNFAAGSEEDCEGNVCASGAPSNPSLTMISQSFPSSAHASEHSSSPSDNHHQLNSTTHKSPSTNSDNSNTDSKQSPFNNSAHSLLSSPTIPRDYQYQDSTLGELYNVPADVGEDSTDGHISNDGLDRWLANDFSNPHVQISDNNLQNMGSQLSTQTLTGSEHNMLVNKPGQNTLFHELSNEKPTMTSLNTDQASMRQRHSVSGSSGSTSAKSFADGLSGRLNGDDDDSLTVSQDLPDIVCDGPEKSHQADQPRNIQGAKSRSFRKSRTLTEAEIFQISFGLLEQEHEILEKSRLCHSCHEKPREVTFLPCGHFITCGECAEPIYVCPLCEKSILATINTFLS